MARCKRGRTPAAGIEPASMLALARHTIARQLAIEGDRSFDPARSFSPFCIASPRAETMPSLDRRAVIVVGPMQKGENARGRDRTCDPKFRKLVLYPTELRGQRKTHLASPVRRSLGEGGSYAGEQSSLPDKSVSQPPAGQSSTRQPLTDSGKTPSDSPLHSSRWHRESASQNGGAGPLPSHSFQAPQSCPRAVPSLLGARGCDDCARIR